MAKRKSSEIVTTADILNVEGAYLPSLTAELIRAYFEAFLKQGFNSQQAYELSRDMLRFYILD